MFRVDSEEADLLGGVDLACDLAKKVVPVFGRWTETTDRRMALVHPLGHGLTGGIGVEAAIDWHALSDQRREPSWLGSGTRGGKTEVTWMKSMATESIDGRFAQDERATARCGYAKEAPIFAGTRRHAAPARSRGAA